MIGFFLGNVVKLNLYQKRTFRKRKSFWKDDEESIKYKFG
jgi:hypothetical protein